MEEVVDMAGTGKDAGDREPPAQLVVDEAVAPREAERRQDVQQRESELKGSGPTRMCVP